MDEDSFKTQHQSADPVAMGPTNIAPCNASLKLQAQAAQLGST